MKKKEKQEFQPVGGEPAFYLRVAGRIGEPETSDGKHIIPAKGQGSLNSKFEVKPKRPTMLPPKW